MRSRKSIVRVLIIVLALGLIASSAWAGDRGWGMGRGGYGMGGGYQHWGTMPGPRMMGIDQNDPRYKVFQDTEKERSALYQKHAELKALFAAPQPDEEKIKALHNEITQLQNQISEKHLQFALEFKKNNPDWQPGYGNGWGRGMGPGGRGFGSHRHCW